MKSTKSTTTEEGTGINPGILGSGFDPTSGIQSYEGDLSKKDLSSATDDDILNLFNDSGDDINEGEEGDEVHNFDDVGPEGGEGEDDDEGQEEEPDKEPEEGDEEGDLDNQNNNKKQSEDPKKDDKIASQDKELITPFLDLLHEELGWEVPEDEQPQSISEFVDYIKAIVDENAENNYASEEVKLLNDYIRSGGDIHSFYRDAYGQVDTDISKIDISNVQNQRYVVASSLRLKGYQEDRISRTISRYEDSGILEEEAQDAMVELQSAVEEQKRQAVEQKKAEAEQQRQQEQQFYSGVQQEVSKLENIRGVPITRAERDQLLKYIFARDREGVTQYQRDYNKNIVKNLIESAYFTMKGDKLVQAVSKRAESDAAQKLREKLRARTGIGKNSKPVEREEAGPSAWDLIRL